MKDSIRILEAGEGK